MAVTINKSLSQTARDLGVSLASLMAANPQIRNPNAILAGTQLNEPNEPDVGAKETAAQMQRMVSADAAPVAFAVRQMAFDKGQSEDQFRAENPTVKALAAQTGLT